jgi:hypothetical protein
MRVKLMWKRSGLNPNGRFGAPERKLRFDESDLAFILHKVYRNMFEHEELLSLFEDLDVLKMKQSSTMHYHRGSFAVFLRLFKSRVVVGWLDLMNCILELIEKDLGIMMGLNYTQELYLYLHTLHDRWEDSQEWICTPGRRRRHKVVGRVSTCRILPNPILVPPT